MLIPPIKWIKVNLIKTNPFDWISNYSSETIRVQIKKIFKKMRKVNISLECSAATANLYAWFSTNWQLSSNDSIYCLNLANQFDTCSKKKIRCWKICGWCFFGIHQWINFFFTKPKLWNVKIMRMVSQIIEQCNSIE